MPPLDYSQHDCPPGYRIRSGTPADDERLVAIENAAGRLFADHGYQAVAEDGFENVAQLRSILRSGDMFVAVDGDDCPVGFAFARSLAGWLHLRELSVDPAHGRKGLGRALVNTVVAAARSAGLAGVTLTTFRTVRFNQPFYESLGFRELLAFDAPPILADMFRSEIPHGIDPAERLIMRFLLD
ncbi:MAG: GNAT family N-acetyltransferase [Rhizobiaceae bacterium]|nr:GNAT family N-acetyltransferase [Rhizobiaceae bacterium]